MTPLQTKIVHAMRRRDDRHTRVTVFYRRSPGSWG